MFCFGFQGDLTKCESLLDMGANLNSQDHAGWTPLHEAAQRGHIELVEVLLKRGASPNVPGKNCTVCASEVSFLLLFLSHARLENELGSSHE